MTLQELYSYGKQRLSAADIAEHDLDAWLLLSFVTGVSRAYYYAHPDESVPDEKKEAYVKMIAAREKHAPLQYLTHQAFFMGYEFYVDESVLIPRSDTEILAEECLKVMKDIPSPRILDLCTGSGCILLSLLCERKDGSGTGVDVSETALATAKRNAEKLGTNERCSFLRRDILFDKSYSQNTQKYDILVSNPPYIRTGVIDTLMEEVKKCEPYLALDGGEDGLVFYRAITKNAPAYLKKGGRLLFEIGHDQAKQVTDLMKEAGFSDIRTQKDLSGMDRVCAAVLAESE